MKIVLKCCFCLGYCFGNAVVAAFCGGKKIKKSKGNEIVLEMLILFCILFWKCCCCVFMGGCKK